ncbi:hypothetical protein [Streptomyces sp. NPDC093261]|uniref:hypothetical protein n=1 Tax=Streptomyces sp. NPDC093261 TaxID=3366037 RepID=UPI003814707F
MQAVAVPAVLGRQRAVVLQRGLGLRARLLDTCAQDLMSLRGREKRPFATAVLDNCTPT